MTDAVTIAIVTNATVIIGLILNRLWGRYDNRDAHATVKSTSTDVKEIKQALNGAVKPLDA